MTRIVTVGAAQLGPLQKSDDRRAAVDRMIALLARAKERGCGLVVFPELALTTFFPRWYMEDQAEIDRYYETEMPGPDTQPLFDAARQYGISFYLGYAERIQENGRERRFNTTILVGPDGTIVGKYRKIHLPGHGDFDPKREIGRAHV